MKNTLILSAVALMVFSACEKETERVGCTDYRATNFIANAQVDDGSCQYPADEQSIFAKGGFGGWDGDSITGGYLIRECLGNLELTEVTVDTVTTSLLTVMADGAGTYDLAIELVNPRNTRYFNDGFLQFKVKKAMGQDFTTFEVYIHGSNAITSGSCVEQRRSNTVTLSALSITEEGFTQATIPLSDFVKRQMNGPGVVFGIKGQGAPDMPVLELDEIMWVADSE